MHQDNLPSSHSPFQYVMDLQFTLKGAEFFDWLVDQLSVSEQSVCFMKFVNLLFIGVWIYDSRLRNYFWYFILYYMMLHVSAFRGHLRVVQYFGYSDLRFVICRCWCLDVAYYFNFLAEKLNCKKI
jgi:hypothetical protein